MFKKREKTILSAKTSMMKSPLQFIKKLNHRSLNGGLMKVFKTSSARYLSNNVLM